MRHRDKAISHHLYPFVLAVSLLACLAARTPSQTTPPFATNQKQSVIRSNSRIVMLDVVVTDKAGNPVLGLTKDDFKVLEDGKAQVISDFETPDMHFNATSVAPVSARSTEGKKMAASFAASSRPETVLVLDELNTSSVDASFGWQMLLKYLRKQPP